MKNILKPRRFTKAGAEKNPAGQHLPAGYNPVLNGWVILRSQAGIVEAIKPQVRCTRGVWVQVYLPLLARYAHWCQMLPGCSWPQKPLGLLRQGLGMMYEAARICAGKRLPRGASAEEQAAQADTWVLAASTAALFSAFDDLCFLRVEQLGAGGEHDFLSGAPLTKPYKAVVKKNREDPDGARKTITAILARRIATPRLPGVHREVPPSSRSLGGGAERWRRRRRHLRRLPPGAGHRRQEVRTMKKRGGGL